jgi:SAM-dependent methyltransferase
VTDYGPETYGDRIADVYDEWYGAREDPADAVEFLAALVPDGRALELAIGTGRIALPLAVCGVEVHGIDASPAMVDRLARKPGGEGIPVAIGDFANVALEGPFALVYVVFNTFFALGSQDEQLRCFANVAERLADGGAFVIEAFVPDLARFERGQRTETEQLDPASIVIGGAIHHPAEQRVESQHVVIREDGIRLYPARLRYAFPPELDLMARLAGLRLRERFGGWRREPFADQSTRHVSVYERA